ncbi:MAG: serine/threonine-protein kinase [Planctomycetota bacterium]
MTEPERERPVLRYRLGERSAYPLGSSPDRIRAEPEDPSEAETQELAQPQNLPPVVEVPPPPPPPPQRVATSFSFGEEESPERIATSFAFGAPEDSAEYVAGSFAFGEEDSTARIATSFAFGPEDSEDDFDEEETLGDDGPAPEHVGPAPQPVPVDKGAGVGARLFAAGFLSAAEIGGDLGRATPRKIGRYQRIESLGKGGTATVYRVRDPDDPEQDLALKLLSKDLLDPQAQARFEREAQILARIDHPSVVKLRDVGRVEAGSFIVLEQISGTPLDEGEEELTPRRAAEVLEQLADAVQALHDAGVLHRDIKPDNVVLRLDGVPVLLDFGTAKDLKGETLTRTGDFLGTPEYVAPEEVELQDRSTLTGRVDVYGLGALLYFMLCGRAPFSGSPLLVLEKVKSEDPTWPLERDPETPEGIDAICRKAMAKDPAERYPSARALQHDLRRFLAGKRPAALGGGSPWPWILALGAALSLVAGVLIARAIVG